MNTYGVVVGTAWMFAFCLGLFYLAVRSVRVAPWWDKLLTYFLVTVIVVAFGGAWTYFNVREWKAIANQIPELHTPAPPSHWWRGASEAQ